MAVCPAVMVALDGEAVREKSAPMPVSASVCGLPAALSAMLRLAVRLPEPVGMKVTLIVQELPAEMLEVQVFDWEKSVVFVPVIVMPVTLRASLPVFLSVTVCGALAVFRIWLAKVRLVGLSTTVAPAPVPVRLTV